MKCQLQRGITGALQPHLPEQKSAWKYPGRGGSTRPASRKGRARRESSSSWPRTLRQQGRGQDAGGGQGTGQKGPFWQERPILCHKQGHHGTQPLDRGGKEHRGGQHALADVAVDGDPVATLCNGDYSRQLKFEVFNHDNRGTMTSSASSPPTSTSSKMQFNRIWRLRA